MKQNKCCICGFSKRVEKHHLQKYNEFGIDTEDNLIYLCPNHHWIADFGDEEDKDILLNTIKKITGKEPLIDLPKKKYYEKLIESDFYRRTGKKDYKNDYSYFFYKKILLSRPSSISYEYRRTILNQLEIRFCIEKLKEELFKCQRHI